MRFSYFLKRLEIVKDKVQRDMKLQSTQTVMTVAMANAWGFGGDKDLKSLLEDLGLIDDYKKTSKKVSKKVEKEQAIKKAENIRKKLASS